MGKLLRQLMLPFGAVSPTVLTLTAILQAIIALTFWWLMPSDVLPTPPEVLAALGRMWMEEGLGHELVTSFMLNLHAIALTIVLSLAMAYLSVIPFFRPIVGVISKGRFLGLVGLTFLLTMYIKSGHRFKVALLVFGMTVFYTTTMAAIVASIPTDDLDYARTLRMSRWQIVWNVVVRGTLDQAIEALRQNFAIGWNMLTMVEGLSRGEGGVGALLLNQNKHFNLDAVFAVQLCILVLGLGMDAVIGFLKNRACPYVALTTAKG